MAIGHPTMLAWSNVMLKSGWSLMASTTTRVEPACVRRNAATSHTYETHSTEYLSAVPSTVEGGMKVWIDRAIDRLPPSAKILEFGSGSGRDADYIEVQGYRVWRTDKTIAFVAHLRALGYDAHQLDALWDPLPSGLDLVFANAVVCHFDKIQLQRFLRRVSLALKDRGRLAFSTKRSGRYEVKNQTRAGMTRKFAMWPEQELVAFVESAGFQVTSIEKSESLLGDSEWLNVVAINRRDNSLF